MDPYTLEAKNHCDQSKNSMKYPPNRLLPPFQAAEGSHVCVGVSVPVAVSNSGIRSETTVEKMVEVSVFVTTVDRPVETEVIVSVVTGTTVVNGVGSRVS